MPAAVAIPAIVGAAGAAASYAGAQKQAKAVKEANAANAAATDAANERNYQIWLESRGVGANGQAINASLPRWANWKNPANYAKPMPGAAR